MAVGVPGAPGMQRVAVGDRIPLGPETSFRVERTDPDAALVLRVRMHPFTGREVDPTDASARLLVRTRGAWSARLV